jgi:hypothetical protein
MKTIKAEDIIAKMGWDWYNTESSARRVAEFCADKLIHPVEEKMYTLKQIKHMFDIGRDSAFQEMHFDEAIKYRDNELNKMD